MFDLDFLICTRLIKVIGNIRIIVLLFHGTLATSFSICLSCLAKYNIFCVDDNTNGLCRESAWLVDVTNNKQKKPTRLFIKSHHLQSLLLCFKKPDVLNVVLHGMLVSFHFLLCLNFKLCSFPYLVPLS